MLQKAFPKAYLCRVALLTKAVKISKEQKTVRGKK